MMCCFVLYLIISEVIANLNLISACCLLLRLMWLVRLFAIFVNSPCHRLDALQPLYNSLLLFATQGFGGCKHFVCLMDQFIDWYGTLYLEWLLFIYVYLGRICIHVFWECAGVAISCCCVFVILFCYLPLACAWLDCSMIGLCDSLFVNRMSWSKLWSVVVFLFVLYRVEFWSRWYGCVNSWRFQ